MLACTAAGAQEYHADEISEQAVIEFPALPSTGTTTVKQVANNSSIALVGKPTILTRGKKTVVGRIINPRVTLSKNGGEWF